VPCYERRGAGHSDRKAFPVFVIFFFALFLELDTSCELAFEAEKRAGSFGLAFVPL